MNYTVLVYEEEDDGDGFWTTVAELPSCFTSGDTIEEIEVNIRDAIDTHLDALKNAGDPLPRPATRKNEIAIA